MSESNHDQRDPTAACGCCEGVEPITPESTVNRPGLDALTYRIGTHASFLETMKARLTSHCLGDACERGGGRRPLAALTTRDGGDPAFALLDAWATVADVLTFYQERIANEGYLRTATERRSIQELARLIGYSPRPGVAASTYLAYGIDENTREEVEIPAGARVQSVPGPDELPQTFETSEPLRARAAWNKLLPRKTAPQSWDTVWDAQTGTGRLYLKGIATQLKANDPLLIVRDRNDPVLYRVIAVSADAAADRTAVDIMPWAGQTAAKFSLEQARAALKRLIETAPKGKSADRLVAHLRAVHEVAREAPSGGDLARSLEAETLPLLHATIKRAPAAALRLRRWLTEAQDTLSTLTAVADSATPQTAAAATEAPPSFAERLNTLIKRPSQPLANALELPRDLASSFRPGSDAGFKTLELASPGLRDNLDAALANYAGASPAPGIEVYALRLRAGVFGRNAPKRTRTISTGEATQIDVIGEWPMFRCTLKQCTLVTEEPDTVFLDGSYEGILPGSWLVLDSSAVPRYAPPDHVFVQPSIFAKGLKHLVARVKTVAPKVTRAEYGISGESVRLGLDRDWLRFTDLPDGPREKFVGAQRSNAPQVQAGVQAFYDRDFQTIRGTAVYAQSERLELAEAPIERPVCGGADANTPLELDGLYQGLEPGRYIIVSGERSDIADTTGVLAAEAAMIAEVSHDVRRRDRPVPLAGGDRGLALPGDRIHTFIRLDRALSYCYRRASLTIYGNVVRATHGETRTETLGGGDGAKALQSFTLKQAPLTYLAAPTAAGGASTLQVFVNDVRWQEQTSLVGLSPAARAYLTRTDDDGKTTLIFGDGREGARLPSGSENVKAVYRQGIGRPGNVRSGQLSLLSTRPQGVKDVTNPLSASGGADAEGRDQARRHAPLAVMALDRLVSTADCADFACSFAGIAKASAAELSDGRQGLVHVTIAGVDDVPIDTGSDLYRNLQRALRDLGDPFQPIRLEARDLLLLVLSAGLRIHPDYRWENVVSEARARLFDTFGFARRELAQDVTASEVLSVLQSVRAVVYVDLDAFGAVPTTVPDPRAPDGRRPLTPEETAQRVARLIGSPPAPRVRARPARFAAGRIQPAQLAVLVPALPDTVVLNQIKD